jgi:hypothetical protein
VKRPGGATAVREWWCSPPRRGAERLIAPWEYRHLRAFGVTRIAGGIVALGAGVVCLGYGVDAWAAFFLAIGALNVAGGGWLLRSPAPGPPAAEARELAARAARPLAGARFILYSIERITPRTS